MSDTIRSETLMEDYNKMLQENIKLKERINELESKIEPYLNCCCDCNCGAHEQVEELIIIK